MKRVLLALLAIGLVAGCCTSQGDEWTAPLQEALRDATRLRVRSGGICHRQPDEERTLVDLQDLRQIAEVVEGIRIDPRDSGFVCECCGDPTLEFYRDDEIILSLVFHHGQSLSWPEGQWGGHGLLTENSRDFLISWMDTHGVSGPREEHEREVREDKRSRASQKRWLSAMPKSLKPFWRNGFSSLDSNQDLLEALGRQYPESNARTLALLSWYGSGDGAWDGGYACESRAEELLALQGVESILSAMDRGAVRIGRLRTDGGMAVCFQRVAH